MGMYTKVWAICKIKKEYKIHPLGYATVPLEGYWDESKISICKEFGKDGRSSFITGKDYVDYVEYNGDLKNYDGTIEFFRDKVLPVICDEVLYFQMWYEEWITPAIYEFKEGKWVCIKEPIGDYSFKWIF